MTHPAVPDPPTHCTCSFYSLRGTLTAEDGVQRCASCRRPLPGEPADPPVQPYSPPPGTAAGWYPLPGGGTRYWDGQTWLGEPQQPKFGHREPSNHTTIGAALALSVLFTPLVGIIWGAVRLPKNLGDGIYMMVGGIVLWVIALLVLSQLDLGLY